MKYGSEMLSIIEGGLEGNVQKVRAYSELLMSKLSDGDRMRGAIKKRLDGSYKDDPVIIAKSTYFCKQCEQRHQQDSKLGVEHHAQNRS